MARDEWSGRGWRQTKAQECQMEIMLHSPRGIRHVINTGCSRWLGNPQGEAYVLRGPHKSTEPGDQTPVLWAQPLSSDESTILFQKLTPLHYSFQLFVAMQQLINHCWEASLSWSIVLSRWANSSWPEAASSTETALAQRWVLNVKQHYAAVAKPNINLKHGTEIASWALLLQSEHVIAHKTFTQGWTNISFRAFLVVLLFTKIAKSRNSTYRVVASSSWWTTVVTKKVKLISDWLSPHVTHAGLVQWQWNKHDC